MKNVTLSADERLIDEARRIAGRRHTTLNEEFRRWLAQYVDKDAVADRAMQTIRELQKEINTGGRKFTREEMNER
ncbi:MAG TPA: hypothetical protein VFY10_13660 [Dehalococcoidia bacterium]|nr:hypothetical protein [Dehalococcoidia bacterium]